MRRRRKYIPTATAPCESKTIIRNFNSLAEFEGYLENGKTNAIFAGYLHSNRIRFDGWNGTNTYEEAVDLMHNGDKESYDVMKSSRESFRVASNAGATSRKTMCRSVAGFMPNVPAALMNTPDCMFDVRREKKSARVINVLYSPDANCAQSVDDLREAGTKVAKAIYTTEAKGVRVNLYVAIGSVCTQELVICVKIKDADQYCNLLKCAYPLVNPAFLRRQSFRATEIDTDLTDRQFRTGMGGVMPFTRLKALLNSKHDVNLNYNSVKWMTQEEVNLAFSKK